MLITHNGEYHIHRLRPRSATDTYCSCPWCGLISDHEINWTGGYTDGGYRNVSRRCVSCGRSWSVPHQDLGEPCS